MTDQNLSLVLLLCGMVVDRDVSLILEMQNRVCGKREIRVSFLDKNEYR